MRHARPGNRADRLELHLAGIDVIEEARAATEEKRNDMNLQFVDEACSQVLLRDFGSAPSATSLPFAARLACLSADSMPSVTKKNVVPPCIGSGSRAKWVSTKTGWGNGGCSPTNPSKDSFPTTHLLRRTYCAP